VITALSRSSNNLDLFALGYNGGVYSAWWAAAGSGLLRAVACHSRIIAT
jgi:hypothetical protein